MPNKPFRVRQHRAAAASAFARDRVVSDPLRRPLFDRFNRLGPNPRGRQRQEVVADYRSAYHAGRMGNMRFSCFSQVPSPPVCFAS
jgi:hypothetical protein